MRKFFVVSAMTLLVFPSWTFAAPPKVAVDIAPLHSLVTQVMKGVATPKLLIQSGASPHQYSMRPSEAKALSEADLVFWVSEGLTPWLEKSLDSIGGSATQIEMLELAGTARYEYREGATFEVDEHHDGRSDDEHEEQADHDSDHHDHEGYDPHAWLDPVNAREWVKHIAGALSEQDPENAVVYQRNAISAVAKLNDLMVAIERKAEKLKGIKFIVFHDAYQYFERRFGLEASGAISLGDASDPSPARIAEIRDAVAQWGVTCAFTEPQYNSDLVYAVFEKTPIQTIGVMDPLGAAFNTGEDHYAALLNSMIASLSECRT
ncbi:ABC-type Zn2+ transport system, periplasmic component/surface adhesin [Hahella chejuensis KCTC 2396]|uniref:High-affinity zinc uptake system protein ZnuA n=1 Tax=Hahella chejuensis (strain KCTC 2396) TaxID=349521 RepID=Q2SI10_HAHCH|nr:zinc ABC transporter substrate-binding protein [Hahella chejuensis]ABC29714.1 ABC-type Zn2+ transport system, periplasmic component/surface adhesin [Hahella chejuensis KCTC 2396]